FADGDGPRPKNQPELNEYSFGPFPYCYFLCVPLLEIGNGYNSIELRITGGPWEDWKAEEFANALGAFVHYAYRASGDNILFTDLQGKSYFYSCKGFMTTCIT